MAVKQPTIRPDDGAVLMVVSNRRSPVIANLTTGYSYVFKPEIPRYVLKQHVEAVMKFGVGFVNPDDQPTLDGDVPDALTQMTPDQLHQKMSTLFRMMYENTTQYRDSFTAAGRPNARWVAAQMGQEVNAQTVDTVWRSVCAEKQGQKVAARA